MLHRVSRTVCLALVILFSGAVALPPAFAESCCDETSSSGCVEQHPAASDAETQDEALDESLTGDGSVTVSAEELAAKRREFENVTRPQYWKREAVDNPGQYSAEDLARMRAGNAPYNHPSAGSDGYPIELHHDPPLSAGGTNDPSRLIPMTRTNPRLGGNYRLNHWASYSPDTT